jgi:hypothetical protein
MFLLVTEDLPMTDSKADDILTTSDEQLRQEQETFDQHKTHEHRWFLLRLVMGYAAVLLLLLFFGVCVYVFLNHSLFPTVVVSSAGAAFFVDIVGLVIAVWKIVFNPDFMTKLAPVTRNTPVIAVAGSTPSDSSKDQVKKTTVLSATYGKGETTKDVTGIIKALVEAAETGCAHFKVNNETMGGDPLKGQKKDLTIVYSYGGETRTMTVREPGKCSIP